MYDNLTRIKAIQKQFKEIAHFLTSQVRQGRLLDIGTGPGRLLLEIYNLNPSIELYGLDISNSMIQQAKKNLAGIDVDLRQGNIRNSDYQSNFFNIITCSGSFYLWDHPEQCLEEIHRLLKDGCSAYLFETFKGLDEKEFKIALRANLKQEGVFQRLLAPSFLKKQIRMTYETDEVIEIVKNTIFADSYNIEKITLGGLPIWLRITLIKSIEQ
ncbi:MAG: class I SAM-dependent methyltransferase [Candidatus Hermodarchaeota archaeon]